MNIFFTGATSGLGKVSALRAAANGNKVIVLARNKEKAQNLIKEFAKNNTNSKGNIEIVEGNLNSFSSLVKACEQVKASYPELDVIVNNAGIMNFAYKETPDGIEETWQVNLLAPMLISHLLFEPLSKSKNGKIIFTSSGLHQGNIQFDDLEFRGSFSSFKVYRHSKLAMILMGRLLAPKLKEHGIEIYSQHPGMVRTELGRSAGWLSRIIFLLMGKSPEKGSETLTYLIETPAAELESGAYYADKGVTETTKESYNMEVAERLRVEVRKYLKPILNEDSPILGFTEQKAP
jgi:NAD(P)-dependent dehydrogenase (short-subunit alcohol dehydrogenase family)